MPTIYPDCMMPDGAEPCGGYRQLYEQHTALAARLAEAEARHRRVMSVIRPFCAKYTPDLLAEFDAAAADSASGEG